MATANDEATKKLIENYLNFFALPEKKSDVAKLKPLLSEEIRFKSPLGEFSNLDSFLNHLKRDALAIRELQIRQVIVEGKKACALYDVVSHDSSIGTLVFSEWFEVNDGKISSITSTYDASDVKGLMARI